MKKLVLFLIIVGCATPKKITVGEQCEIEKQMAYAAGYDDASLDREEIILCVSRQIQDDGSLSIESLFACIEMGSWYEY